jgi:hypothetical protein
VSAHGGPVKRISRSLSNDTQLVELQSYFTPLLAALQAFGGQQSLAAAAFPLPAGRCAFSRQQWLGAGCHR